MSDWIREPIGKLVKVRGGGTPKRDHAPYFQGNIPWVTPKDIKKWDISSAQINITEEAVASSAANVVPKDSVLLVVRSGVLKHTAPIAIARVPVAINQDMKSLECNDNLQPEFLARFLKHSEPVILSWVKATTADNYSIDQIKTLEIPLPPLDEQRRISTILDQADALRGKRRDGLKKVRELGGALFDSMFGDLLANDRKWPRGRVGDLVASFESGKSLVADDEDATTAPYRVLKISAVTSLRFQPSASKALPEDYEVPPHHLVRSGDLLFSRANTAELIGATAYVDIPCDGLALPDKLWRFCWPAGRESYPLFVWQLFMQPQFREQVSRRATGTSGSMKNISQQKVLGIEIGLPDLSLQKSFSEQFSAIRDLERQFDQDIAHLDALFASLQHRAFRGEL